MIYIFPVIARLPALVTLEASLVRLKNVPLCCWDYSVFLNHLPLTSLPLQVLWRWTVLLTRDLCWGCARARVPLGKFQHHSKRWHHYLTQEGVLTYTYNTTIVVTVADSISQIWVTIHSIIFSWDRNLNYLHTTAIHYFRLMGKINNYNGNMISPIHVAIFFIPLEIITSLYSLFLLKYVCCVYLLSYVVMFLFWWHLLKGRSFSIFHCTCIMTLNYSILF